MKIFIVCSRLGYGGAERVGVLLANGFAEKGHDVTLVSNLYEDITYNINNDVKLLNLVLSNNNKIKKWLGAIFILRKHLRKNKPNVVIGIMGVCSLISKIASIGMNIPIIMTEHNSFERPKHSSLSFWDKILKFHINKIYGFITVLTNADKLYIGNKLKNVFVMPNPLSLNIGVNNNNKEKTILAAGRLEDWHYKGFDILLTAWGKIAKDFPDWTLEIAGKGSEEEMNIMKEMASAVGISDRVKFLGFRKDIETLYKKASVFVLSSRYEGFGLVLIEAMSQGCACVACDYKGRQREIITNDNEGVICEPENADKLADSIRKLLNNKEYMHTVQKNAVKRSLYYSKENTIKRWDFLLNKLLTP